MYYGPSVWRQVSPPLIGQSRVRILLLLFIDWLCIFRVLSKSRKSEKFNRTRYKVWDRGWWWCSNRCPVAGNPCPNTRGATRKDKRIRRNMDTKIYQVLFWAAGDSETAKQGWLFVLWIRSVGDAINIWGCSGQCLICQSRKSTAWYMHALPPSWHESIPQQHQKRPSRHSTSGGISARPYKYFAGNPR